MRFAFAKKEDASEMVLTMIVCAVFSVLATRLYLKLTGYPQISMGRWHLAHVLDGGLFMVVGMLIMTTVSGEKARRLSVIIFGLGMGRFVDEMGKFISRDNNYFFQPAVMLIYIFFIVMFLVYRYLDKAGFRDPKTLLFHVIDQLEDVAEGDFEVNEKNRILNKLEAVIGHAGEPVKSFAIGLKALVIRTPVIVDKPDGWGKLFWKKIKRFSYQKIFRKKFVLLLLSILALGYIASSASDTAFLLERFRHVNLDRYIYFDVPGNVTRDELDLFTFKAAFDVATAVMFAIGMYWVIRKKRRRGISFFQYGLLIFILLTSIIRFYFEQFIALQGLMVTMVIYMGLERFKKELKT